MSERTAAPSEEEFEALLDHLRDERGFDFTGYKRASLRRRVERRMADVGASSTAEYRDLLEVSPDEFTALFNTILINVTSFFRDTDTWSLLRTELLPQLLASRPTGPLRVWSAGCASGQEAYTAAVVLADLLGPEQFRARVKIYATDVDEEALAHARSASYSEREVAGIPAPQLEAYFERSGARWTFRPDLRRSVIFGRADLVQDAPISHVDLLLCRNTLMYLTGETQARIAERLHYSLTDEGLLVLGKAEMLLSQAALFAPVDLKNRVFRRVGTARPPARSAFAAPGSARRPPRQATLLQAQAVADSALAQVLLEPDGRLAVSNRRADALFGTSAADVGRPFQDLEVSYRPVELRAAVDQARTDRRPVWIHDVHWSRRGEASLWFDVQVAPLLDPAGEPAGTAVAFFDVTRARELQNDLEVAHRQLETAYEELQSTNEELETTNEELQSTVEELETTNEEVHSTNEELETMNEELQSMNDELQTSNSDLRRSTDEVDSLNRYMDGVFSSLHVGVVVVDTQLRVQVWNRRAADLWGLRSDEVAGEHLMTLDVGLPVQRVGALVRAVLAGQEQEPLVLDAVNRRGRAVTVQVVVTPVTAEGVEATEGPGVSGAVVVMDAGTDGSAGPSGVGVEDLAGRQPAPRG